MELLCTKEGIVTLLLNFLIRRVPTILTKLHPPSAENQFANSRTNVYPHSFIYVIEHAAEHRKSIRTSYFKKCIHSHSSGVFEVLHFATKAVDDPHRKAFDDPHRKPSKRNEELRGPQTNESVRIMF